jgi:hypothetical protein
MTFRIEQQVTRLQISVEQIGRVHIFQTFEALINDVLLVDILENICSDNGVQICIHEIKNKVNISIILRPDYVLKSNDVFMTVQLLQEDDFSKCPLSIGCVLKGIEVFLERNDLF